MASRQRKGRLGDLYHNQSSNSLERRKEDCERSSVKRIEMGSGRFASFGHELIGSLRVHGKALMSPSRSKRDGRIAHVGASDRVLEPRVESKDQRHLRSVIRKHSSGCKEDMERKLSAMAELRRNVSALSIELESLSAFDHITPQSESVFPAIDDATLLRFLIARNFNVENAYNMLIKYIHWRVAFPENKIQEEEIRMSLNQNKMFLLRSKDKKGNTCLVMIGRRHRKADVTLEETQKAMVYVLDKVIGPESMEKLTVIINLQGVGKDSLDIAGMKKVFETLQNYYPERLALLMNWQPPSIFYAIYRIVLPFVDANTKSKVSMAFTEAHLKDHFEMSELPSCLGGTGEERDVLIPIQHVTRQDRQ